MARLLSYSSATLRGIDERRFRALLLRSLGVLIIAALVLAATGVWQAYELLDASRWVEHSDTVISRTEEVERYINATQSATRGFLLTGDAVFLEPAESALKQIGPAFNQLEFLVQDNPIQGRRIRELRSYYEQWLVMMNQLVGLKRSGGDYLAIIRSGAGETLARTIRSLTQTVITTEVDLRTKRDARVHEFVVSSEWIGGALFFAFLIVFGAATWRQIAGLSELYGDSLESLERSHAELETKVEERTAELREKNRLLRTFRLLAENVRDYGIVFIDPQGYVMTWTASAERMLGYAASEIVGKHFSIFYRDEETKAGKPELEIREAGEHGRYEDQGWRVRKGGAIFWANVVVTPIYEDDHLIGFGKIIRDITESKRLQDAQAAANKELEAFSYSVSHDLRAPLRGIDGFSKALLEDYGQLLDETARGYLDRVRAGTQRMGRLIDDMLSLSRVSRAEARLEPISLSEIAKGILSEFQSSDPSRKIEVSVDRDLTDVGDPGLIRIALENLLSNAWKFTSKTPGARIHFGRTERDGQRVYYVRDNGAGFDMSYKDKLFEAFQRLHRAEDFPGTGIGLATVRRILLKHGGRVWAESKPGVGSTFYFTLGEHRASAQAA